MSVHRLPTPDDKLEDVLAASVLKARRDRARAVYLEAKRQADEASDGVKVGYPTTYAHALAKTMTKAYAADEYIALLEGE